MRLVNRKTFYLNFLLKFYKKFINGIVIKNKFKNEILLFTTPQFIFDLADNLSRNSLTQFRLLGDICVVDYPNKKNRFELIYNILSVKYNFRVFLKTYTSSYISSLSSIFKSSN